MRVFEEKQRFTQWWLWLILAISFCSLFIDIIQKAIKGEVISVTNFHLAFWISFAVMFVVVLLLKAMALITEINENGIAYRFYPFQKNFKRVNWSDLEKVRVRQYKPLFEYGGWGYRKGVSGGAYNVKGNQGIQLVFKTGKKLLIGTQQPKDVQYLINKYFRNNE